VKVVNNLPAVKKHKGRVGTMTLMVDTDYIVEPRLENDRPWESPENETSAKPHHYGVVDPETKETVFRAPTQEDAWAWKSQHLRRENAQPALHISQEMRDVILGGQPFLQRPTTGAPRGAIEFGPNRTATINLFETADLSTFLHETGHLYLEVFGDLIDRFGDVDDATLTPEQRQMRADYGAILTHLGVTDRSAIGIEQHERFARSFETYLMEGKAPSIELRQAFARFRAWLLGIYRNLRSLNAPLTDEVRKVFDRMLVSDQAIAEAEADASLTAIFTTPEDAGMSPARFALYRDAVAASTAAARERLDHALLAEVQREQTAQWKARQKETRAAVTAELDAQPVYRAIAAMHRGTNPDGTAMVEGQPAAPMKLSKALLIEQFGRERLATIPTRLYSVEGGVDAGVDAE
jgi:hypothetical protein